MGICWWVGEIHSLAQGAIMKTEQKEFICAFLCYFHIHCSCSGFDIAHPALLCVNYLVLLSFDNNIYLVIFRLIFLPEMKGLVKGKVCPLSRKN